MKKILIYVFIITRVSFNLFSEDKIDIPKNILDTPKYLIETAPSLTTEYLPLLRKTLNIPIENLPNPIGVSLIYSYMEESYKIKEFRGDALGQGIQKWDISNGEIKTKTHSVGAKVDIFLLPFLQLFVIGAYVVTDQTTDIGVAKVPLGNIEIPFNIGALSNRLEGFVVLSGFNVAFAYRDFFFSFMLAGGYARLDDVKNNVTGFVEKPLMYIAPRIGYMFNGVLSVYVGIQRIELFGATKGKDLSTLTGGLVKSYEVEFEKFPVNFLVGSQFMITREFGISLEYVGSPDVNGVNLETVFRF